MKRGTKLLWGDMPGVVTEVRGGEIQAEWAPGYDSPFSGRGFWGAEKPLALGQIQVVGENGKESAVPPLMEKEVPVDLFEQAFQLSFEI